jgi:uncharacterized protein HemX
MSSSTKAIIAVVVLVVIAAGAGAYWYYTQHASTQTAETVAPGSSPEQTTLVTGNDSSDAALQKDAAQIDTQLQGVASDNASADQAVAASAQ